MKTTSLLFQPLLIAVLMSPVAFVGCSSDGDGRGTDPATVQGRSNPDTSTRPQSDQSPQEEEQRQEEISADEELIANSETGSPPATPVETEESVAELESGLEPLESPETLGEAPAESVATTETSTPADEAFSEPSSEDITGDIVSPEEVAISSIPATLTASAECQDKFAGDVIAAEVNADYSLEDLAGLSLVLGHAPRYRVRSFRILYCTPNPRGELVKASGAAFFPLQEGEDTELLMEPLPLVSYQHGTQAENLEVPSNPDSLDATGLAAGLVTLGYAAVAADYLGLGESSGIHPFLHAATEASSTADLISAAGSLAPELGVSFNRDLYLVGYSQGGHATMALHRHLQETSSLGFEIVASAPMGGPYHLSGTSITEPFRNPSAGAPFYAAYLVVGMQEAYGLFESWQDVFREDYLEVADHFALGEMTNSEYISALPIRLEDLLADELRRALSEADETHPAVQALQQNDVYDWLPLAPMKLFHSSGDESVPFSNSERAFERMTELGASDIELVDVGSLSHAEAIFPAFQGAIQWFEEMRQTRPSFEGDDTTALADQSL